MCPKRDRPTATGVPRFTQPTSAVPNCLPHPTKPRYHSRPPLTHVRCRHLHDLFLQLHGPTQGTVVPNYGRPQCSLKKLKGMARNIFRLLVILPLYVICGIVMSLWYIHRTQGFSSWTFSFVKHTPTVDYKLSKSGQWYPETISNGLSGSSGSPDGSKHPDYTCCNSSVLTLFTTFRDSDARRNIHNTTLRNWASLRPALLPVLFLSPDTGLSWPRLASQLGWRVEEAPRLKSGVPVLKSMFQLVLEKYPSPFVGFANADNIFGPSLLHTLNELGTNNESLVHSRMSLVVGRRRNLLEDKVRDMDTSSQFVDRVGPRLRTFREVAQDYFIVSSRSGYCWKSVPDFVIGRVGFDNWLVVKAQMWNISLIDATNTINDVHLVGKDGVKSGWNINEGEQKYLNHYVAGEKFNYKTGLIGCAYWRTVKKKQKLVSHIVLTKADRKGNRCARPVSVNECVNGL